MSDEIYNHRARHYDAPEETPADTICRRLLIPNDPRIRAAVWDVIAYLSLEGVWNASEGVSELQMIWLMSDMFHNFFESECDEQSDNELLTLVSPYVGYWWV